MPKHWVLVGHSYVQQVGEDESRDGGVQITALIPHHDVDELRVTLQLWLQEKRWEKRAN